MTSTIKILCITNDFGPRAGGIETFVIGLIERMPRNTVVVYTSSQKGSEPFDKGWLDNFGVEVIRDKSMILLPTLRVGRAVRKVLREKNIERVFFGAAAPLGLLAPGLRRAGAKKIVALTHGHEVWWAKVPLFNLAIRRIARSVDALTYLGSFTKGAISKSISAAAQSRMVRIAPGIDINHFSPQPSAKELRRDLGLHDKKVLVSVGRLVHRKGQDFLIEALPAILKEVPNTHLLFVGEGPYREHLQSLVDKYSLRESVTFIGRVQYSELPRYICVGDVFAMPSRSRLAGLEVEGLGIVYLEASACGLPVIGGKSGGAPDAVIEGETGFAVDGLSSSAIAERAIELLQDSEKATAMGAKGRAWVVSEWNWNSWSRTFNELLDIK